MGRVSNKEERAKRRFSNPAYDRRTRFCLNPFSNIMEQVPFPVGIKPLSNSMVEPLTEGSAGTLHG